MSDIILYEKTDAIDLVIGMSLLYYNLELISYTDYLFILDFASKLEISYLSNIMMFEDII